MVESINQDLRYGFRSLRRTPGFTIAAIVTLALGIGANTAIFSVMDAVLLKTVPVRDPQQLHFLAHGTGDNPSLSANYPLLERYRTLRDVLAGVTAYTVQEFKVATASGPQLVPGQFVAGNYHDVLGVPFIHGRGFSNEPDRPTDGSLVAVISEGYWSRAFGRDSNVIGKTLVVQGKTVTVVGVTGAGFHGLRPGTQFDVTLPLAVRVVDEPGYLTMQDTWTGLNMVARLKAGVTEAQALRRVDAIFQQYMSEPEQGWLRQGLQPPDAFRIARLLPAGRGTPALRNRYDRALRTLMAMVGVFLLIACVNVANLLLVRASARANEVAIRSSLGATRVRLVRQFFTESLLLAACGGAAGLVLAPWITTAIVSLLHVGPLPIVLEVEAENRVLAFTAAVSLLTAVAFGLLPSLKATSVDVTPVLKEYASTASGRPRRQLAGRGLAACQIALCVLLLAGTGLLVRSLYNFRSLDGGFQNTNVLLFYADTRGTDSEVFELYPGLLDRLEALPGVRAVSFSTTSPLATDLEGRALSIPGLPPVAEPRIAINNRVSPAYFSTFDIRILHGRGFTTHDSKTTARVAVVNETLARAYFGGSDAVGRAFRFGGAPGEPVTIVGIARDARQQNLREPAPRMVYVPLAQAEEPPSMLTAAVRTTQSPRAVEAAVRDAVRRHHADLVISYVRTIEEQIDASLVRERLLATLATGFGLLALLLACVGLYGVMSYGVARRTREIGIRIALGAQRSAVLWQVIRETLGVCAGGVVIGLAVTLATTRLVATFLFGLSERDPLTLLTATVVLVVTALLAGYVPARRAARTDPAAALRAN